MFYTVSVFIFICLHAFVLLFLASFLHVPAGLKLVFQQNRVSKHHTVACFGMNNAKAWLLYQRAVSELRE